MSEQRFVVLASTPVGQQVATATLFTTKDAAVAWAEKASEAGHATWNAVHGSREWIVAEIVATGEAAWVNAGRGSPAAANSDTKDFELLIAGDRVLFGYDAAEEPWPWYWECVGEKTPDEPGGDGSCTGTRDTAYGYKTRDDAIAGAKRCHGGSA